MSATDYGRVLLTVADELCTELGYPGVGTGTLSALGEESMVLGAPLTPESEALVRSLRRALARIAAALGTGGKGSNAQAVALDGAELVIRRELAGGNSEQLTRLMPSFVFLVALPVVDHDRAFELSRKATELIARATEGS